MSPVCKALPAVSRITSAAGALAITSVLLLTVGLGFSPPSSGPAAGYSVAGGNAPQLRLTVRGRDPSGAAERRGDRQPRGA